LLVSRDVSDDDDDDDDVDYSFIGVKQPADEVLRQGTTRLMRCKNASFFQWVIINIAGRVLN
jgi:hypothetical protein